LWTAEVSTPTSVSTQKKGLDVDVGVEMRVANFVATLVVGSR